MPEPTRQEEQAVDYVLGQLDPGEIAEFEGTLATSPELRAIVHDLEAACGALALAAPQTRPSKRVWQRIAERTRIRVESRYSRQNPWVAWVRLVWRSGWGVALFAGLAWFAREWTHSGFFHPLTVASHSIHDDTMGNQGGGASSNALADSRLDAAPNTTGPQASASRGQGTNSVSEEDARRLRSWVQQLASEVGDLKETLARQTAVQPGSSRYQVFRLSGTNAMASPDRDTMANRPLSAQEQSLEQWLASSLARQLVASSDPKTTESKDSTGNSSSQTQGPPGGGEVVTNQLASLGSEGGNPSFQVIELAAVPAPTGSDSAPLSDTSDHNAANAALIFANSSPAGIGFYSVDTGQGSVAFSARSIPSDQTLQLWALDSQTGTSLSLGTTGSSGVPLLIRFTVDPTVVINPAFMITLEPLGGSSSPGGTVVLRPRPPSSAPAP